MPACPRMESSRIKKRPSPPPLWTSGSKRPMQASRAHQDRHADLISAYHSPVQRQLPNPFNRSDLTVSCGCLPWVSVGRQSGCFGMYPASIEAVQRPWTQADGASKAATLTIDPGGALRRSPVGDIGDHCQWRCWLCCASRRANATLPHAPKSVSRLDWLQALFPLASVIPAP